MVAGLCHLGPLDICDGLLPSFFDVLGPMIVKTIFDFSSDSLRIFVVFFILPYFLSPLVLYLKLPEQLLLVALVLLPQRLSATMLTLVTLFHFMLRLMSILNLGIPFFLQAFLSFHGLYFEVSCHLPLSLLVYLLGQVLVDS